MIDDIDATFRSTSDDCLRVSTFFSAARALAKQVKGIRLRVSVRADVWSSIRRTDEALDKVEQYVFDLRWSRTETGRILAQRVRAYLKELDREKRLREAEHERDRLIAVGVIKPPGELSILERMNDVGVIDLIFDGRWAWANQPHHFIHVLSGGRPRWGLQLCRLAAAEGHRVGNRRQLKVGFAKQVLQTYGRLRIDDLTREHRHQCPQIDDLVQAFARQRVRYTTDELMAFIEAAILRKASVEVDGSAVVNPMAVAHFLYRCDFLLARDKQDGGNLVLYRFEEKPQLLTSATNPDEGLVWEVAPGYRQALNLSGDGAELS